jgi:hypothetical protein
VKVIAGFDESTYRGMVGQSLTEWI